MLRQAMPNGGVAPAGGGGGGELGGAERLAVRVARPASERGERVSESGGCKEPVAHRHATLRPSRRGVDLLLLRHPLCSHPIRASLSLCWLSEESESWEGGGRG